VAYGASLESWLGASPHGFESHILRSSPTAHPPGGGALYFTGFPAQTVRENPSQQLTSQMTASRVFRPQAVLLNHGTQK
jgi:hypothetical protein